MAVSYVHELAGGSVAGDSVAFHAFTLSAGASAGNLVVLALGFRAPLATSAAVTDSRGNTWTVDVGPRNFQNKSTLIASTVQNVGTLQAADTVTATLTGDVFNSPIQIAWWVEEFTGNAASSPTDKTAFNDITGGFTGPTGTTAATTQADEVAVAVISVGSSPTVLTAASYSAFTTGAKLDNSRGALAVYKILSATGTQSETFSWTAGVDDSAEAMIATYKALFVAPPASPPPPPLVMAPRIAI